MDQYRLKTDFHSSHQIIFRTVCKYLKTGSIVDLGCDKGFLGQLLSPYAKTIHIHGVDRNRNVLKKAKGFYQSLYCFDLNDVNWPLKDRYDMVVIADTLEHLVNPREAISAALKIVKDNGFLIISVPNGVHLWVRLQVLLGRFPQDERGLFDRTHLHYFTKRNLEQVINSFPKTVFINYFPTTIPLQFVYNSKVLNSFLKIAYSFSYLMALIMPNSFAYQHIYVYQKKT
jgi:2-polyprenyl-3-methyl-5-hydroxy-6-metoxy-1,4-benzoquinol methylase